MDYKAEYKKAINKERYNANLKKYKNDIIFDIVRGGFTEQKDNESYVLELPNITIHVFFLEDNISVLCDILLYREEVPGINCTDYKSSFSLFGRDIDYSEHSIQEINKVFKQCLDKVV